MGQTVKLMGKTIPEFFSPFDIKSYTGESVEEIWPFVASLLDKAVIVSRKELSLEYIKASLLTEHMQLWIATENGELIGTMVTELIQHVGKKVCNVVALDGSGIVNIWHKGARYFLAWMIANEVDELEATCRNTVADMLRSIGFEQTANVMTFFIKEKKA